MKQSRKEWIFYNHEKPQPLVSVTLKLLFMSVADTRQGELVLFTVTLITRPIQSATSNAQHFLTKQSNGSHFLWR